MKSILADFRMSKTAILIILEALNFGFWKNITLEMPNVTKNSKFSAARVAENPKIFTFANALCIPN